MRGDKQVLFWSLAAVVLLLLVLLLKDILLPFVAGMVIAYFLNPLADRLTRLGLNRSVASIVIVAVLVVAMVTALVFLLPLLAAQLQQLAGALPEEAVRMRGLLETWARQQFGESFPQLEQGIESASRELANNWASWAGYVAQSLWSRGLALFNFIGLLLVTPLVVFYLLVDWQAMLDKVNEWLPRQHAPTLRRLAGQVNEAVSAFIRGQGTICFILGVYYAIALSLAGLDYGLLIGIATGVMVFVPVVGWTLSFITATALAVVQHWPEPMPVALVVGVYLVGQGLDAGFLAPKIVGSKVGLHPVWLIFSLFTFGYLFGFVGALVAVPVAAAVAVLVRFALQLYLSSKVYSGPSEAGTAGGPPTPDNQA